MFKNPSRSIALGLICIAEQTSLLLHMPDFLSVMESHNNATDDSGWQMSIEPFECVSMGHEGI